MNDPYDPLRLYCFLSITCAFAECLDFPVYMYCLEKSHGVFARSKLIASLERVNHLLRLFFQDQD